MATRVPKAGLVASVLSVDVCLARSIVQDVLVGALVRWWLVQVVSTFWTNLFHQGRPVGSNAPSHEEQTRPTPNAAGYVPKQTLPTRPGGRTDDGRDAGASALASRSKQTVTEEWSAQGRN